MPRDGHGTDRPYRIRARKSYTSARQRYATTTRQGCGWFDEAIRFPAMPAGDRGTAFQRPVHRYSSSTAKPVLSYRRIAVSLPPKTLNIIASSPPCRVAHSPTVIAALP